MIPERIIFVKRGITVLPLGQVPCAVRYGWNRVNLTEKVIFRPYYICQADHTGHIETAAYLAVGGGWLKPPPKFRRPSKIVPNSTRLWKLLKIAEFRRPTPQDARKKGSKILKLPSVRNCFTLAMTDKLVVIINSLKVPKIKRILLYEMKFLVPIYSCLQNPWLVGYRPRSPFPLSWTEFVEPPPPPNKIPG